ncbi:conserved exported protein of unknown function [Magnetospira sp. QH-2]|nr:conserved exported protein of unknown function [Magnetospira sp. QH-2]
MIGLCLLIAFAWSWSSARAADAYAVTLPVDVSAASAAAAREQALADGRVAAFRVLMERMTLAEDWPRLPEVLPEELPSFLRDISVANEKTSEVRYLADLTVRYRAEDIRDLLRAYDIPFAETFSKPVMVLPVYGAGTNFILWDEPNPWREAWQRLPASSGLVPLAHPIGDLQDMTMVDVNQARDGSLEPIGRMAQRYGTDDVLVPSAEVALDPTGQRYQATISVKRFGPATWMSKSFTEIGESEPGESEARFLDRLVTQVAARVEDEWKRDNLLRFDSMGVVAVTVPVNALPEWLAIRKSLGNVAVISQVDVVLLVRDEVRLNLHHIGDIDQLALALAQADLTLSLDGDQWRLSRAAR